MPNTYTERDIALREEASKQRSRAYRQRRNEYDKALNAATDAFDKTSVVTDYKRADDAYEEARDRARNDEDIIRAQIAALEQNIKDARVTANAHIDSLKQARSNAREQKRKTEQEVRASVHAQFPDIAGVFGPSSWKPLDEFLPKDPQG